MTGTPDPPPCVAFFPYLAIAGAGAGCGIWQLLIDKPKHSTHPWTAAVSANSRQG